MRSTFDAALKFVLDHENVYEHGNYGDYAHVITENVAGDAGGLTKWGIDQASHPDVNIKALDYEGAKQIYFNDEWLKCRCDDLPAGLDAAVFDIAVNNGKSTAIVLLQRALNVVGTKPPLTEDGHIGPKTIQAALWDANAVNRHQALDALLRLRDARYLEIVANHPSQKKFERGWLDRNRDLTAFTAALLQHPESVKSA